METNTIQRKWNYSIKMQKYTGNYIVVWNESKHIVCNTYDKAYNHVRRLRKKGRLKKDVYVVRATDYNKKVQNKEAQK